VGKGREGRGMEAEERGRKQEKGKGEVGTGPPIV